ncbi:hypothetical protein VH1709_contig00112-0003 [Vibrio harveyi]|uniref:DUF2971 domain-containing protein n=1 Tax=Vibrio harveyi TaxID=669 RepID=UPI000D783396|nr:DUF2971 domain-containing protein [Vibrio harveyi]GBL02407.1 hypothetical protein VH1709_contig00112-0003 [Vibrio harveyi]
MDDLLYKYRNFNERALEIIINQELWLATPSSLNDPFDCQIEYAKLFDAAVSELNIPDVHLKSFATASKQAMEQLRVLSLSNSEVNPLLWSHYADSHQGFCLGFNELEFEGAFNPDLRPKRVIYSDSLPKLEFPSHLYGADFTDSEDRIELASTLDSFLQTVALTKPEEWKVENESRIVTKHPMQDNVISFSTLALKEVIFGLNMPTSSKRTIQRLLADKKWKHVRLYQISKATGSFELKKVPY